MIQYRGPLKFKFSDGTKLDIFPRMYFRSLGDLLRHGIKIHGRVKYDI